MDRKKLWSDRPSERSDTKTREVWIELQPGPPLVVGLRVDVKIDTKTDAAPLAPKADSSPRKSFQSPSLGKKNFRQA